MPAVRRVRDYDDVQVLIGWDVEGNLRVTEETEWEQDFHWKAEPRLVCFHVPVTARPKKKEPLHLWLDLLAPALEVGVSAECK
jgi:hypothetical protein